MHVDAQSSCRCRCRRESNCSYFILSLSVYEMSDCTKNWMQTYTKSKKNANQEATQNCAKWCWRQKKATQNCAKPVRQGCREIKTNGITACFSIKNTYRGTAVAKWMEKSHIVTLRNDMAFYDGRWLLTVCRLLLFAVFQVFQILQGTARAPMALVICMLDGFSCPIAHIQKAKQ